MNWQALQEAINRLAGQPIDLAPIQTEFFDDEPLAIAMAVDGHLQKQNILINPAQLVDLTNQCS